MSDLEVTTVSVQISIRGDDARRYISVKACRECGAYVWNTRVHREWHQETAVTRV